MLLQFMTMATWVAGNDGAVHPNAAVYNGSGGADV